MKRVIDSGSAIWRTTFVFAGAGSTFLGPFMPRLASTWHLRDHQAGFLISCFFLGSFTGTLMLSRRLEKTLKVGAWTGFLGLLFFSCCVGRASGFAAGLVALTAMGFGLGQLMSSINLLVGRGEESKRARSLAGISAAWCLGAVLSPALTTVLITSVPITVRLALCSPLFLWPILWTRGCELSTGAASDTAQPQRGSSSGWLTVSCISVIIFLLYGGIEASIAGWTPLFATRYRLDTLGDAQWIASSFWIGLSAGRIVMASFLKRSRKGEVLWISIAASTGCLLWLAVGNSPLTLLVACTISGIFLGPVFPLLLDFAIGSGLSTRSLGAALAACGLGAAVFPSLVGIVSTGWSLRAGMFVPLVGLTALLAMCGLSLRSAVLPTPMERI